MLYLWKNGDKYEGEWKDCLKHGRGIDRFANGDSYRGQFSEGKPHGKGVYKWKNGSIYKGEFVKGMKQGKGFWTKNSKNGMHVYNGRLICYILGEYFEDNRHGYGEMKWADGSEYKGFWKNGVPSGKGRMLYR